MFDLMFSTPAEVPGDGGRSTCMRTTRSLMLARAVILTLPVHACAFGTPHVIHTHSILAAHSSTSRAVGLACHAPEDTCRQTQRDARPIVHNSTPAERGRLLVATTLSLCAFTSLLCMGSPAQAFAQAQVCPNSSRCQVGGFTGSLGSTYLNPILPVLLYTPCVYARAYLHAYVRVDIANIAHMHTCEHAEYTHACNAGIYTHTRTTYIHRQTHTFKETYIHTYGHTYRHTCKPAIVLTHFWFI